MRFFFFFNIPMKIMNRFRDGKNTGYTNIRIIDLNEYVSMVYIYICKYRHIDLYGYDVFISLSICLSIYIYINVLNISLFVYFCISLLACIFQCQAIPRENIEFLENFRISFTSKVIRPPKRRV